MVKALACALPAQREQPLSRYRTADLTRLLGAHPACPPMSASTILRLLDRDALKPWRYQHWLFPRDPQFAAKAGRVPDLYAGWWDGQPLSPDDRIISADEKTSIQARRRIAPTTPPRPGQPMRVEHELGHTVTPSPYNPLGVKGLGESGTTGAPPALVNAALDALAPLGVRALDMPLTAERIWRAMQR